MRLGRPKGRKPISDDPAVQRKRDRGLAKYYANHEANKVRARVAAMRFYYAHHEEQKARARTSEAARRADPTRCEILNARARAYARSHKSKAVACGGCNNAKNDRTILEFLQYRERRSA
jgi:hypothetical protein